MANQTDEAIIAIDPSSREGLGVARYIRSKDDGQVADVAPQLTNALCDRGTGVATFARWRPKPATSP